MSQCSDDLKRCHEGHSFIHAYGQLLHSESVESQTCILRLALIALVLADPRQDQTASVVERLAANRASPSAVMPRYADGDMVFGKLPSSWG